ncbi:MAG: hypothetical protein AB7S70_01100 [Hyphomicrobium sp.]|uniref:hypothetical protein n=1 Tax=Hyphomicrobium sp. TaxID=82 RepID=UPI003D14FC3F
MTTRAFLPFRVFASTAVSDRIGRAADHAAVLALRAVLRSHRQLEVAHQQVVFRGHILAFSSHVTAQGELVIELDLGDPKLSDRVVLEDELRRETRRVRGIADATRRQSRSRW